MLFHQEYRTIIQQQYLLNQMSNLALRVSGNGLEPEDSRAVLKCEMICVSSINVLHAESLPNEVALRDNQMVGFIRFGNDFTQNFYQIEIL
jgi:cell surface protein SprA